MATAGTTRRLQSAVIAPCQMSRPKNMFKCLSATSIRTDPRAAAGLAFALATAMGMYLMNVYSIVGKACP